MRITGIRSVDFKIASEGEGIVNWNGGFSVFNSSAGKFVDNHLLPKMRNVDPMRLKSLNSDQFDKAQIFVSQNCIRSHLFRNESLNLKTVNTDNVERVLQSILGLVRGYVIADKVTNLSLKRKSSLLLEDFVAKDSKVRFEQFGNAGERNETSMFSKTQADQLNYLAYGSISIEDLQFIVLEDTFSRSAFAEIVDIPTGQRLAKDLTQYLKTLDFDGTRSPEAVFHHNYVRAGGFMNTGEAGLLLNDDALDLIVSDVLERIKELFIRQSKGYLRVTDVLVDYNDGRPMRIKEDEQSVGEKNKPYAVYYVAQDMSESAYQEKIKALAQSKKDRKKKGKEAKDLKATETDDASAQIEQ